MRNSALGMAALLGLGSLYGYAAAGEPVLEPGPQPRREPRPARARAKVATDDKPPLPQNPETRQQRRLRERKQAKRIALQRQRDERKP